MFSSHTSSILLFRNTRSSYHQVLISLVALTLILFLCMSNVYSAQATLSWSPNSESDLAGYKVYYGNSSGSYSSSIDAGNQTSYTISNLVEGEVYFFAATAYDFSGNESGYSNEVSRVAQITSVDTTPPTITSVNADSAEQVVVVFSEPVEESRATSDFNYGINNGIMVYAASLGSDQKTVTLTTSSHSGGDYVLTVNNIEDLASIPNVIAVDTTVGYTFLNQLQITNLNVSSGESYEVIYNGLQNGALVYIDRTYTYSTIPTLLQGTTYIKTANADKTSSGASFLTFEVNQDVTVYVAHDDRITTKPSWLVSFTDTGDNLVTTDTPLSIFASNYLAGTITLGGNKGGGGSSMYAVVIVGKGIDTPPPPADGNSAPVLDPISDITVNEGDVISFSPTATDPDGDAPLTYTYSGGWMTTASYTTNYQDVGDHTVTVTVSDGMLTDSQDVTVTVNDVDTTPPNSSIIINDGAESTNSTSVTLSFSSYDEVGVTGYYVSDSLSAPSATDPGWVSITPTINYNANVPYTLSSGDGDKTIYVWYKDAAGNVSAAYSDTITLITNSAPVLDPILDITVNEGDVVSFSPSATDPAGDSPLTYTYSGGWMDSNSYTTSYNDAGMHTVTVTVSDGTLTDSQDVTVTVNDVSQLVISNLKVASSKTYQIVDNGLQNGASAYVDRKYKYSTVPASLQGSTYIMTANNDKRARTASFLTFDVNQDVTVYVAHDDRITKKPSWLSSFADTGDNLVTTDTPLSVFVRNYPAGTITLGGNGGDKNKSMYTVVIVGQ